MNRKGCKEKSGDEREAGNLGRCGCCQLRSWRPNAEEAREERQQVSAGATSQKGFQV